MKITLNFCILPITMVLWFSFVCTFCCIFSCFYLNSCLSSGFSKQCTCTQFIFLLFLSFRSFCIFSSIYLFVWLFKFRFAVIYIYFSFAHTEHSERRTEIAYICHCCLKSYFYVFLILFFINDLLLALSIWWGLLTNYPIYTMCFHWIQSF